MKSCRAAQAEGKRVRANRRACAVDVRDAPQRNGDDSRWSSQSCWSRRWATTGGAARGTRRADTLLAARSRSTTLRWCQSRRRRRAARRPCRNPERIRPSRRSCRRRCPNSSRPPTLSLDRAGRRRALPRCRDPRRRWGGYAEAEQRYQEVISRAGQNSIYATDRTSRPGGCPGRPGQVRQRDQRLHRVEPRHELTDPGGQRADSARSRLRARGAEGRGRPRVHPHRLGVPAVGLRRRRPSRDGGSPEVVARPRQMRSRT